MTNPTEQTLDHARAALKLRFYEAYFDSRVGRITVALVIASLIALAAAGNLSTGAILTVGLGWSLAIPLAFALLASVAAGAYPPAEQHAQTLATVAIRVADKDVDRC